MIANGIYLIQRNIRVVLYGLFFMFFFSGCKKNDGQSANGNVALDASGTWSTSSLSNSSSGFSITSSQFPCLAFNKLVLNADGTATQSYSGADTCYLSQNPLYILGIPGTSAGGRWSQKGDSLTIQIQGIAKPGLGVISKTASGYQLSIRDSVQNSIAISIMVR